MAALVDKCVTSSYSGNNAKWIYTIDLSVVVTAYRINVHTEYVFGTINETEILIGTDTSRGPWLMWNGDFTTNSYV